MNTMSRNERGQRLRELAAMLESMPAALARQTLRERHGKVGDRQFVFEARALETARKANHASNSAPLGAVRGVFSVDTGSAGTAANRPPARPASNDEAYKAVLRQSGSTAPETQYNRGVALPGAW